MTSDMLIEALAEEIRQTALTGDMFEVIELYERLAKIEPADARPLYFKVFGILQEAFDYVYNYGEESRIVFMYDPSKRKEKEDLEEDGPTMEFNL